MKIYGKNALYAAIKAERKIEVVYLEQKTSLKEKKFIELLKDKKIKYKICDKKTIDKDFPGLNQGFGAIVEDYQYIDINTIIDPKKRQLFVLLDGLEDPHNLGAILRTADAFSVDAVVIPKNRSVKLNETVIKVSTGAIEYVNVCEVNNLVHTIALLKEKGFWIVGTDAKTDLEISNIKADTSLAIIIGSEGFGMSRLVKESCDYLVKIPMTGHVNSLNASVSCGIVLNMVRHLQK